MTRVVFVTPNQGRQAEVQRLLADVQVELSRLGPAVPDGLDFEASARARGVMRPRPRSRGSPARVSRTARGYRATRTGAAPTAPRSAS